MKKYIGYTLWIAALIIPMRYALLDTEMLQSPEGANNVAGLIHFVLLLALIFIGYALVDGAGAKASDSGHAH
ncbi:MAG: hypothetical protein KF905_12880 [Flavobacteriales bacterium]|nr:hypothetical protein [Flavobacteriales bacterium]